MMSELGLSKAKPKERGISYLSNVDQRISSEDDKPRHPNCGLGSQEDADKNPESNAQDGQIGQAKSSGHESWQVRTIEEMVWFHGNMTYDLK